MNYLQRIDQQIQDNLNRIGDCEKAIAAANLEVDALRAQIKRLEAGRAVIMELEGGGTLSVQGSAPIVTITATTKPPTLKSMILALLSEGGDLSKPDFEKALKERNFHYNNTTLGTTLSKMASSGEIEKAGHFAYRRKSEVPNGLPPEGTSDATESSQAQ
jgi:hypothetical protein